MKDGLFKAILYTVGIGDYDSSNDNSIVTTPFEEYIFNWHIDTLHSLQVFAGAIPAAIVGFTGACIDLINTGPLMAFLGL